MRIVPIALIGSAALLAGAMNTYAQAPTGKAANTAATAGARQCFRSHDMRNHTVADDKTMYVDVGGRDVYRVAMRNKCLVSSTSTDTIVTHHVTGTDLVCRPLDLDISISRAGFESACIVDSITRLAPAEVAALPPKLRP